MSLQFTQSFQRVSEGPEVACVLYLRPLTHPGEIAVLVKISRLSLMTNV